MMKALLFVSVLAVSIQLIRAQDCDIPKQDVDYDALKKACEPDDVCAGCLETLINNMMEPASDGELEILMPIIYKPEMGFDFDVLQKCATPYIPDLMMNQVFQPFDKAMEVLSCSSDRFEELFADLLDKRGMGYLMESDASASAPASAPEESP